MASLLGDRYHIQQQLGKKPGRQTLLARDLLTQNLVIVKVLFFGSDFEWDALKLFEREAETLKSLSHPSIPRYLDYLELDTPNGKGFALVQTYIEAKSLEEQLKAGRTFSEAEIKQIAKTLLEILIYLHGRTPAVIHRDIKPSNILLANRSGHNVGQVYLVDFGSVQTLAASEGSTITVVGTYGYMPPEQFGGRAVPASDLYSLGATLIYLVTGLHPADLPQIDLRIQFEQAVNLSEDFINWLKWMTEPSLNRRLATVNDALLALEGQNQRQRETIYPTVVRQPAGSKVLLTKKADALEIIIPQRGFRYRSVGSIFLALLGNLILVFWTGTALYSSIHPGAMGWLFFLWGIDICIILKILFSLFGRLRCRIDGQQMTISYELFGIIYTRDIESREQIFKLVHRKRYSRPAKFLEYTSSSGYVLEKPRLIIWVGTQQYELCSDNVVSEPELDWLAYELNVWLGLPIARE